MDNILEKGVSYFIIDSFLKAVRDNTVGNPGGNPDQAVSMGFSNVSRLISVAIGESVVKHFYLQHDDVTLVQKLTEQHFRAIEAADEKTASIGRAKGAGRASASRFQVAGLSGAA